MNTHDDPNPNHHDGHDRDHDPNHDYHRDHDHDRDVTARRAAT